MSGIYKQSCLLRTRYVRSVEVQVVPYTRPKSSSSLYAYYFGSTLSIQYDAVYCLLLRRSAAVYFQRIWYDVSHTIDRDNENTLIAASGSKSR